MKRIKNNDTVEHTWVGQTIEPGEYFTIESSQETSWANDSTLLTAIATSLAVVNNGTKDLTDVNEAINFLKGALPVEVISLGVKNEHNLEPWGAVKGVFESIPATGQKYVCNITLSNVSQNGLTFSYNSDIDIDPEIGNYVFQNDCAVRSWVTAVDRVNHTVTFELPVLSEGAGIYSKGYWVDCTVKDWATLMYLWGATINVLEYEDGVLKTDPCGDFLELSIVDNNDLFAMDAVTQQLFGVNAADASPYLTALKFEQNGEYGHWTKYYDESWAVNCLGQLIKTPDGAPASLIPNLVLRLSFFSTEVENHKYHIYIDYYATSKDA